MINIVTNRIINKDYSFSFNKINDNIKICLFSDIHISNSFNIDNLTKIKSIINRNNPDYIFIAGDIIDSLKVINNNKIDIFYEWLNNLGNIDNKMVPVICILGNHDYYSYSSVKFDRYMDSLSKLNIYLLDNSVYEDEYIRVVGFNVPSFAYHSKNSFSNFKKYIMGLDNKLFSDFDNKVNIAMIHNPLFVINPLFKDKFDNFDLILAGHMHNGLMLPFLDSLFKGNRGIISPDKKLLPKVSRNKLEINHNKYLVISGGITKLSEGAKRVNKFNIIFPMEINNINIDN